VSISEGVQIGATHALSNLSQEKRVRALVAEAGGVPSLVKICQTSQNEQLLAHVTVTLQVTVTVTAGLTAAVTTQL
jgi:hypothetical protein